jgi:hypothetical protein
VSGRIERVADTGKPKPSRHGRRAIKTDLEFSIERISKLPKRKELALRPLYIIAGSAGLVIAWIELFRWSSYTKNTIRRIGKWRRLDKASSLAC